jgi:RNA recognition motif-containing protein
VGLSYRLIKTSSNSFSFNFRFVRFLGENEAQRAVNEMHGFQIAGSKIVVKRSVTKK